jgi:hypothetical protein
MRHNRNMFPSTNREANLTNSPHHAEDPDSAAYLVSHYRTSYVNSSYRGRTRNPSANRITLVSRNRNRMRDNISINPEGYLEGTNWFAPSFSIPTIQMYEPPASSFALGRTSQTIDASTQTTNSDNVRSNLSIPVSAGAVAITIITFVSYIAIAKITSNIFSIFSGGGSGGSLPPKGGVLVPENSNPDFFGFFSQLASVLTTILGSVLGIVRSPEKKPSGGDFPDVLPPTGSENVIPLVFFLYLLMKKQYFLAFCYLVWLLIGKYKQGGLLTESGVYNLSQANLLVLLILVFVFTALSIGTVTFISKKSIN